MKTLLYVSCSVRKCDPEQNEHQSITRQLANQFLTEFKTHEITEVIYRDLVIEPPSLLTEAFIAAAFAKGEPTPAQRQVLAESDKLIQEIEMADIIVIASPMYNYGMPAALKAWFDLVIRVGKTFSFDLARGDSPLEPILSGKSLVLLASWGEAEFRAGQAKHHLNHLSSHIAHLAPYLGASTLHEVASEYQEFGDERHQKSKQKAMEEARTLAKALALS